MIMYKEALGMLMESVNAMGADHKYETPEGSSTCLYVHESSDSDNGLEPGCIIGDMLIRQHILTLEELKVIQEELSDGPSFRRIAQDVSEVSGKRFSSKAIEFLVDAQRGQDGGAPWGAAVANARRVMEDIYSDLYAPEEEGEIYLHDA